MSLTSIYYKAIIIELTDAFSSQFLLPQVSVALHL